MKFIFHHKNILGFSIISALILLLAFNLFTAAGTAELQAEGYSFLRRGSEGNEVEDLQNELKRAGFRIPGENGYYGLQTEIAVKQFQKHMDLTVDGLAGEETLSALNSVQGEKDVPVEQVEKPAWSEVDKIFNTTDKVLVTDVETGLSLRVSRIYGTYHADVEPIKPQDAEVLREIYGGEWSWERRPVVVQIDDRLLAGSITGMPHGENVNGHIQDNNFAGHFDIHFRGSRRHRDNEIDERHQNMVEEAAEYEWPLFRD